MRDRQVILANIKPHQNTCPQGLVFVTLWREVHINAMWLRSLVSSTFVLGPLPSPPSSPCPTLPAFYLPYLPSTHPPYPPHPLLYQSSLTSSPTYPLYPLTLTTLPYPCIPLSFLPSLPLSHTLATHALQPHPSPNDVVFCTYFGCIYGPVPGSGGTSMKENVQSKIV